MAKKIKFESFKYRFLVAARERALLLDNIDDATWLSFTDSLIFRYYDNAVMVFWSFPSPGSRVLSLRDIKLYVRGDKIVKDVKENSIKTPQNIDLVKNENAEYFAKLLNEIFESFDYHKLKQETI